MRQRKRNEVRFLQPLLASSHSARSPLSLARLARFATLTSTRRVAKGSQNEGGVGEMSRTGGKLPENRILFVKNCSFKTTGADLYDLFGKYGSIRQIRMGNGAKTKGTAFVVFEEPLDVRRVTPAASSSCSRRRFAFAGQDCIRAFERIPFARTISRRSVNFQHPTTPHSTHPVPPSALPPSGEASP